MLKDPRRIVLIEDAEYEMCRRYFVPEKSVFEKGVVQVEMADR